jgi:hypothetical protein
LIGFGYCEHRIVTCPTLSISHQNSGVARSIGVEVFNGILIPRDLPGRPDVTRIVRIVGSARPRQLPSSPKNAWLPKPHSSNCRRRVRAPILRLPSSNRSAF